MSKSDVVMIVRKVEGGFVVHPQYGEFASTSKLFSSCTVCSTYTALLRCLKECFEEIEINEVNSE